MKNKTMIIIVAFLAVLICLIITVLLFYAVPPRVLVILSFIIGILTGVLTTFLVLNIIKIIRNKRSEDEK